MTLWTPENTFRIRGSGRRWFERIIRETFGDESQNIIEPPPSGQQPPLLLHSSLQPVYIVNGAEFQSNPTQLEANVQAEISAGRGTLESEPLYVETVNGAQGVSDRQFVNFDLSATIAFQAADQTITQTHEINPPANLKPWSTILDISLGVYSDAGRENLILWGDADLPLVAVQLETQYLGNQYAEQTVCTWSISGTSSGEDYYLAPLVIYDAIPLGHPFLLDKVDQAYNGPILRIIASRGDTGTAETVYASVNVIVEVWDDTGGNSADYPYATSPMTWVTGAFS